MPGVGPVCEIEVAGRVERRSPSRAPAPNSGMLVTAPLLYSRATNWGPGLRPSPILALRLMPPRQAGRCGVANGGRDLLRELSTPGCGRCNPAGSPMTPRARQRSSCAGGPDFPLTVQPLERRPLRDRRLERVISTLPRSRRESARRPTHPAPPSSDEVRRHTRGTPTWRLGPRWQSSISTFSARCGSPSACVDRLEGPSPCT